MSMSLDNYLGLHTKSLELREHRASQIANNLANVNTPHYKAKDIDFQQTLSQAMTGQGDLSSTNSAHINAENDLSMHTKYRTTRNLSLDGNTVDKDIETKEFSKNALAYQASLTFLNNKLKTMMMAIRGE